MRQVGEGAPVRLPVLLELPLGDQERRDQARGDEEPAHDQRGGRQQPASTANAANRIARGIGGIALHQGHHRDPGLEAGQAEGEFREDEQGDPDHHEDVPMLLGERSPPVGDHDGVVGDVCESDRDDDRVQNQVDDHQDERDVDGLAEPAQEDNREQGNEHEGDRDVGVVERARNERVLDGVRRGIRC